MIIGTIIATTAGFVAAHSTAIAVGFELAFAVGLEVEKANKTHEKNEDLRERHGMTENRTVIEHMADLAIDYAEPIGYVATWLALGAAQLLAGILIICWKLKIGFIETVKCFLLLPTFFLSDLGRAFGLVKFVTLWPAYTMSMFKFALSTTE